MDNDIAIKGTRLSKIYKLYDNPHDRFKETFHPFRKKYHHRFYALKDVSFEVKKGDTIGIIGKNGAGKSTLLQIIYNAVTPTSGSIEVNGRVSALLELGSGFNPELTGVENVYFYGSVMGYSNEEMEERLDDILSFADIGEFAYQPMKMYSTGMFMRLAFSAAIMADPEFLLVDEALSVGDMFFQAKCIDRIKNMIDEKNLTLIFVSHDLMTVKSICKKAMLLDSGKIVDYGESAEVVDKFFLMTIESQQRIIMPDSNKANKISESRAQIPKDKKHNVFEDNALFLEKAAYQRVQNGKASIVNVQLLDENEELALFVEYEQKLTLRVAIEIHEDIHTLEHGYQIRNEDGVEIVHSDSIIENKSLHNLKKGNRYIIDWRFKASLTDHHGNYTIATGLLILINYDKRLFEFCDRVPISFQFHMNPRPWWPLIGMVCWDNEVDIVKYE